MHNLNTYGLMSALRCSLRFYAAQNFVVNLKKFSQLQNAVHVDSQKRVSTITFGSEEHTVQIHSSTANFGPLFRVHFFPRVSDDLATSQRNQNIRHGVILQIFRQHQKSDSSRQAY